MYIRPAPSAQTAASIAAFDVMLAEPERRVQLQANAELVMIFSLDALVAGLDAYRGWQHLHIRFDLEETK